MAAANPFAQFAPPADNPFAKFGPPTPDVNPFAQFAAPVTDPYSQRSWLQKHITDRLMVGVHNLGQAGAGEVAMSNTANLGLLDKIDELQKQDSLDAHQTSSGQDAALRFAAQQGQDPDFSAYAKGTPEEKAAIRQKMQGGVKAGVEGIVSQGAAAASIPGNPASKTFAQQIKDKNYLGAMKTLATNPSIFTDTAVESAPQMAGAVALTPIVGPEVGMGATSFATEAAQDFTDAFQQAGVDVSNPKALYAAMQDKALVEKARSMAIAKGIPVGLFDAISGGLASKTIAPEKIFGKELGKVGHEATNIVLQAPAQAALGAAGEATGQLREFGQIKDPASVAMEAVGEFGGTPGEVLGLGVASKRLLSPDVGAPISEKATTDMLNRSPANANTPTPSILPQEGPEGLPAEPGSVPPTTPAGSVGEAPKVGETPYSGGANGAIATPGERLTSAALKIGDQVFTGSTHGDAFEAALKAGVDPADIVKVDMNGFVTSTGRYVGREEALQIAQASGQKHRQVANSVTSQGTTAPTFEETQKAREAGVDPNAAYTTPPTELPRGVNSPAVNVIPSATAQRILYHGHGRDSKQIAYNGLAVPILGNASYYAMSGREAKRFGPNLKVRQDTGLNPLLITNDVQWRALTKAAGWEFPNPYGTPEPQMRQKVQALQDLVKSQGFDSVEVQLPRSIAGDSNEAGESVKTLRNVFDVSQVAVFDNAKPTFHIDQPMEALAKENGQFSTLTSAPTGILSRLLPGYDPNTHVPGTVVLHDEPVQGFAELNHISQFMKELAKNFFNGAKVVLSFTQNSPLGKAGANGRFIGTSDGTIVIWINPTRPTFQQVNSLMHEAGHATAWWNLYNTDQATQQAILGDYQKYLITSAKMPPEEAMAQTLNASVLAFLASDVDSGERVLDGAAILGNEQRMKVWFDFDEWMAEQFARWMSTNQKPFTLVEKWFKNTATKIRNVFRLFGFNPDKSQASSAMTEWLAAVQERNAAMGPSSTPAAILHSHVLGVEQLQNELGEDWGEDGPGLSMPSFGMRNLARAMGMPQRTMAGVDKFNWWINKMWGLLQIAAKNPHIVGLQRYVEAVRAFHISKMAMVSQADFRLREWRKLGKDMGTRLSNFMFDLDSLSYLPKSSNLRWPTNQEMVALVQKHGLNAASFDLYLKMKADFDNVLNKMQAAWVRDAQASITDPVELWAALQSVQSDMGSLKARPYFPHERFGEWSVAVRDSNNRLVFFQQFANRRTSEQAEAQLRKDPQYAGHEITGGRLPREVAQFRGLPPALIRSLASRLNLTAAQQRQLEGLILDLSPANTAAKRFKKRAGTPGHSLDGMRAYAQYFLTMSGHIARLEHNGEMQDAIKNVADSANAMRGAFVQDAVDKRRGIAEWMQRTYDYLNDGKSEWQGLRSFAFVWYLGYNISSALVNLTQVPMVALPYISARFGDLTAMNELRKAYSDIRGTYLMQPGALSPETEQAIKLAVEHGFVDESMATELATAASGGTLQSMLPGTMLQRGLLRFANVGAVPFQLIEKLNRRVTFLAAFRAAQKAGANHKHLNELRAANQELFGQLIAQGWLPQNAAAFLAGRDAVERSQFEYAKWARPEFMRGKKAVLFTFYMFKQNMLWFLKNSPGAGRAWVMLLAGAGLMGLPGADALEELIKFLAYHVGGKYFSPEKELRKLIVDQTNVDPDLVMHGLGYHTLGLSILGDALGVPVPDIDLSSRIGMDRTIPGVGPALALNNDSWDERFGKSAQEVLGAGVNVPLGILKAIATSDPDSFKQIERGLPTAFKNLATAYRWADQGAETTRSGAEVDDFDIMDSRGRMDIAAKALGFNPTSLSAKRELTAAQHEAGLYWTLRRNELFSQFAFARQAGDKEAIEAVKEAVRQFNASAPNRELRVTSQDLVSNYKERRRANKKMELGVAPTKGLRSVYQDMNALYPTAASGASAAVPKQ